MRLLLALLALLTSSAAFAQTDYAARLTEGDVTLRDFRFRSGETLPELRMHYATLGTPRRDAQGRITNAVMVLHGTGGSGPPVPPAAIRRRAVRPRPAARHQPLLRHPPRQYRPWPLVQAERRPAHALPGL